MDWESLKFFLAVAREGTLAGAGRSLGVTHSTVLRRIAALEGHLGLTLFERHPGGLLLTAAGKDMLDTASRVGDELVILERRLSGQDLRLTGTVRLAAIGVLVPWIADALTAFHGLYPGIVVEVTISPATVSLTRHEADIAIRVSGPPPDSLIGRRIATLAHGVYAVRTHRAAFEPCSVLGDQAWITYAESRNDLPQARWVNENVPGGRIVLRSSHTGMMLAAVKAGLGLAVLPCYLGDAEPTLCRLRLLPNLGQEMWLLTHRDLRQTPRIRVVMDFLTKELLRHRDLIEGRHSPEVVD